jgi:hypothetical protein
VRKDDNAEMGFYKRYDNEKYVALSLILRRCKLRVIKLLTRSV